MQLILHSNISILFLYSKKKKTHLFLFLQRNTFQLVLASTELTTHAILLYPKDGMLYFSTPVEGESQAIEAGFSQGLIQSWLWSRQGPYYRIPTNVENTDVRELAE